MRQKTLKYIAAAMAATMALTACSGAKTSADGGNTEKTSAAADISGTGAAETGGDSAVVSVADPGAVYKDTLNIAVAQQAPSLDLHKNSSLIARHTAVRCACPPDISNVLFDNSFSIPNNFAISLVRCFISLFPTPSKVNGSMIFSSTVNV